MQPLSARTCFVIFVAFLAGIAAQSRYAQQHQKRTTLTGDIFSDEAPGHEWTYKFRHSIVTNSSSEQSMSLFESQARAGTPGALPGRSASPPLHSHRSQTECFSVRRGVIGYIRNGEEGHIAADSEAAKQPVCVPPGVSHAFWNAAADTDLHVDVTLTPPGNSEAYFRTLTGFAHDQGGIQLSKLHLLLDGIRPSGFLGPCQLLATFVAGGVKLEGLPPGVWWTVENVLVPFFIVPVLRVTPMPAEYTQG